MKLSVADKILRSHSNVFRNLSQKKRRNVPACVKRDSCATTIGMPILFVRTALSNFHKAEAFKNAKTSRGLRIGMLLIHSPAFSFGFRCQDFLEENYATETA